MDDVSARKFQKDLNGGLVSLVLLAVLARSGEELYGYEIAKRLAGTVTPGAAGLSDAGDGATSAPAGSIFKEGTLYPVLRALSAADLLSSRVEPSLSGPPRRYYRITDQGRAVLAQWKSIWAVTRSFVDRFVEQETSA